MKSIIKSALSLSLIMLILVSIYTLVVYGIAQFEENQGKGTVLTAHGKTYFANVGQAFQSDTYFQSRPSEVGYNSGTSGGSNKAPSDKTYLKTIEQRLLEQKRKNPDMGNTPIPVDLLTASGSGLDPEISVAAAQYQIRRIAKARNLAVEDIQDLIDEHTYQCLLGPSGINVLKLNIELDRITRSK